MLRLEKEFKLHLNSCVMLSFPNQDVIQLISDYLIWFQFIRKLPNPRHVIRKKTFCETSSQALQSFKRGNFRIPYSFNARFTALKAAWHRFPKRFILLQADGGYHQEFFNMRMVFDRIIATNPATKGVPHQVKVCDVHFLSPLLQILHKVLGRLFRQ